MNVLEKNIFWRFFKGLDPTTGNIITDKLSPLTNQTYAGQFNLSTNYEVEYNEYTTNVTETPTISASPLIDAIAGVIFKAGASAGLVTTNMGVAWPGNDTYTANKSNYVAVMQKKPDTISTTGLWYIIKVLN